MVSTKFLAVIAVVAAEDAAGMASSVVVAEAEVVSEATESSEDAVVVGFEDVERGVSCAGVEASGDVDLEVALRVRREALRESLLGTEPIAPRQFPKL